jgi:hypothetical protein
MCPSLLTLGREFRVRAPCAGPSSRRGPGHFTNWAPTLLGCAARLRCAGTPFLGVPVVRTPVNILLCVMPRFGGDAQWIVVNLCTPDCPVSVNQYVQVIRRSL